MPYSDLAQELLDDILYPPHESLWEGPIAPLGSLKAQTLPLASQLLDAVAARLDTGGGLPAVSTLKSFV